MRVHRVLALAAASAALLAGSLAIARVPIASAAGVPPGCPPGFSGSNYCSPPQLTAILQWTFFFTRTYTRVVSLVASNAARTTLHITCKGRGCPYTHRTAFVTTTKPCGAKHKHRCPTLGTLDLTHSFKNRHLSVGTNLTVAITRSGWIGKYYVFTVLAGHPPRVGISCLAPGSVSPTGTC